MSQTGDRLYGSSRRIELDRVRPAAVQPRKPQRDRPEAAVLRASLCCRGLGDPGQGDLVGWDRRGRPPVPQTRDCGDDVRDREHHEGTRGALALKLANEGRVSLEDPLSRTLPRWPHADRIAAPAAEADERRILRRASAGSTTTPTTCWPVSCWSMRRTSRWGPHCAVSSWTLSACTTWSCNRRSGHTWALVRASLQHRACLRYGGLAASYAGRATHTRRCT